MILSQYLYKKVTEHNLESSKNKPIIPVEIVAPEKNDVIPMIEKNAPQQDTPNATNNIKYVKFKYLFIYFKPILY